MVGSSSFSLVSLRTMKNRENWSQQTFYKAGWENWKAAERLQGVRSQCHKTKVCNLPEWSLSVCLKGKGSMNVGLMS